MRNLKRVLSLALALVMMLGMMIVGANAASAKVDFADADEIAYTEAVDVMVALGVLEGDGTNYNPADILTREQAAKIICYMLMGPTNAEKLVGTSVFTDVAADRWSAPFIAYCDSLDILAGNGDGTFDPTGKLTGVAFAKMLLVALGYDPTIEGYVNNKNWATNIGADAIDAGLNIKGIDLSAPVTREQAAQMALNTLTATMVKYTTKGTSVTIDGIDIVTGASEAEPKTWGTIANPVDYKNAGATNPTDTIQFCEKYFDKLYQDSTPVNGQKGYTWKLLGETAPVSDFVVTETVIGTRTDGTGIGSLITYSTTNAKYIADIDTTTAGTTYKVFVNGAEVSGYTNSASGLTTDAYYYDTDNDKVMKASNATTWADINGNGVKIELIDTDKDTKTAEKIYVTTYEVATVNKVVVKNNTADGKDYIYVDFTIGTDIGTSSVNTVLASKVTGYEGLKKNDVVTVIAMANGTYEITKLEPTVAQATAVSGTTLTIDGKAVKAAKAADSSITGYSEGFYNDVNFYFDAYGYTVYAEAVTTASTDYLMPLTVGNFNSSVVEADNNKIQAVFDDGSVKVISVEKVDSYSWSKGTLGSGQKPSENAVYSYTVNADGTYNLTAATTKTQASNDDGAITKGVSAVSKGTGTGGEAVKGDANTIYVVKNAVGNTYTAYTGYTNVPSMTGVKYSAVNGNDTFADVVFVYTNTPVSATSNDVVYLLSTTYTTVYKSNGSVDYYTLPAVVNGEKTDVKLSMEPTAGNLTHDTTGISANSTDITAKNLYSAVFTDGKLGQNSLTAVTDGTDYVVKSNKTVKSASNGVLTIDSVGYNYTDTTMVYVISYGPVFTVTATTVDSIDEANYDVYAVTQYAADTTTGDAGQVTLTAIYLQELA